MNAMKLKTILVTLLLIHPLTLPRLLRQHIQISSVLPLSLLDAAGLRQRPLQFRDRVDRLREGSVHGGEISDVSAV